jgi:CheY-like chemotaxis protein
MDLHFTPPRRPLGLHEDVKASYAQPERSLHRVLVIDDSSSIRLALAYLLRMEGFLVTDAAGGQDGLRQFREAPVDLVVTDLEMPDLSGWEVARAVRLLQPDLPVLLITGHAEAMEARPDLRALVSVILLKPFSVKPFLNTVKELMVSGRVEAETVAP